MLTKRTIFVLSILAALAVGCNFSGQSPTSAPTTDTPQPQAQAASPTQQSATSANTASSPQKTSTPQKTPATATPSTPTAIPPTPTVLPVAPTAAPNQQPQSNGSSTGRILAWNPDAKQVAWYVTAGAGQPLESGGSRAAACAISPDNNSMVVYHGDATGPTAIVSLTNPAQQPIALGDSTPLACDLSGHTIFSPNGSKVAYIQYTGDAAIGADFVTGKLRILSTTDGSVVSELDSVTTFDLGDDGAAILQFYPNAKKEADRADLTWWDSSSNKSRSLEINIKSLDGCTFAAGRVLRVSDKVYTALGEKCANPTTFVYRVLRTDFAGGNTINFVQKSAAPGSNFPTVNTDDLAPFPDGQSLLFLYPNGLTLAAANMNRLALADGKVALILNQVVTDQSPLTTRKFLFNRQRTQLAFVQHNVNGGETLFLYDLTQPTQPPTQITDANRSDQIVGLAWNQTGDRLAYVLTGDDSALGYFDLHGANKLLVRGTFQGLVLSPDGQTAATIEQVKPTPGDTRYNLVTIAMGDGTKTAIVSGAKGASPLTLLAIR